MTGAQEHGTDGEPVQALPLWARPAMRSVSGGIFRPGGLQLTDRMAELAGVLPGWRIADMGCGQGASVLHLRQRYGAKAVGVDSALSQAGAAGPGRLPLAVGDAANPPFMNGSFRMVLCECVLSLLPDTQEALRAFRALLEPGGMLAVSDLYYRHKPSAGVNASRQGSSIQESGISCPEQSCAGRSCLGWGADRADVEAHLRQAGFALRVFEDHSDLLGELAARLVMAGEPLCRPSAGSGTAGYFLMIADRLEDGVGDRIITEDDDRPSA
ncbi:MAG: DVU_1556 family methyltransferase [Halodesulfovibrio sp.]